MKKTQRKDAVRNIRKRIVSYLSVCLVIMLGLGGFLITRYMGEGIDAKASAYYNERSFKDYELISSLGITDDDLTQIKETDGVTDAEGVIRAEGTLTKGDLKRNTEIISLTERISVPELIDGRFPAAKDECMIGEDFAAISGLKTGDRVHLSMDGLSAASPSAASGEDEKDEGSVLYKEEFTVTGLMKHPDYMRRKSVNTVVLPWAAYNKDVTGGYFTHVFVKAEEPEGTDIFSEKFFEKTADQKKIIEELTDTLAVDAAARAKEKAYKQIDEEWQKALAELEDAQSEIDSNEASLNSELADARKDLEDAQRELDGKVSDANKKIKAGEKKIKDAEKKIKAGEKELKENKEKMRQADELLPEAEEYIRTMREEQEQELKDLKDKIAFMKSIIAGLDKVPIDSEIYKEKVMELAGLIIDSEKILQDGQDFFKRDDVMEAAEIVRDITGIDTTGAIKKVRDFNLKALLILAKELEENEGDYEKIVAEAEEYIKTLEEGLAELDEYEKYIEEYKANHDDLVRQLEEKEKELAKAKEELAAAKKKLAAAKKEMAAEKSKYQAKINSGWSLYYSQKAQYESKLEEAKALLAENREAAEAKLEEARAEVEKIECKWLVLDRRGNAGYVDIRSGISSIRSSGIAFGALFLFISSIVCFSTLAIIIEEQKKMVGTVKAFGFRKREILGKYMTFGVSAAVIGCIAAIALALGLSGEVLRRYAGSGMYQFGIPKSVIASIPTAVGCACMILVCALATVIACTDILKSPASILMKGGRLSGGSAGRKTVSSRRGSLYSRLILRNMLEDRTRVGISIAIIAFSTLLVGAGISMKLAYDGMSDRQVSDIHRYDIRVDLGDSVSDAEIASMIKVLDGKGAAYTRASYETHLYRWDGRLDALNVLTGDPDELGEFFNISDTKTGEALALPEDGVLIQNKMRESYGMKEGSEVPVLDSALDEKPAHVTGTFRNYVGRLMVTSPEGYKATFGEDPAYNCLFVKTGGEDREAIENGLLAVSEDISFSEDNEFATRFQAASYLYNLIVYMTTGIAIIMSFMILTNLANIFLNRKKTELTVMRINGFSIKQTRGYLVKETIVTTAAGVVLGVLLGAAATPVMIKMLEQPDLQFIRSFHPVAWIAAVVMEILFAVIIYGMVFRKVKDLDFRDIA